MALATGAAHLHAGHAGAPFLDVGDGWRLDGRGKARPAAAAFILRVALEQRRAAAGAQVFARSLVGEQSARPWRFGAGLPQDAEALGPKLLPPLLVTGGHGGWRGV